VHRYFWPDQANCGQILWHVAQHFQLKGHQVDILSSLPSRNYNSNKIQAKKIETIKQVNITRINLSNEEGRPLIRIFNALKLGIMTNYLALQNKYDVIISTTVPPILGGFFSSIAAKLKKSRLYYFCMDLYPEVGKISGDFSNPIFFKLLEKIDNWNCKQADLIIVHSSDMKRTLEQRKTNKKLKIKIINNFSVPSESKLENDLKIKDINKQNKLSIIFAGNIGRFQRLDKIVEAMSLIKYRSDIELIIMGDGVAKKDLKEQVKKTSANVTFFDYQPINIVKDAIKKADIGLVTLMPNTYKYAYPGKVMTYLEQGRPFISTIEPESELARTMKNEGFGFSVEGADITKIANLFTTLADDTSWKIKMNDAAKIAYKKNFSMNKILNQWSNIIV
tara:strand:+ start:361 stop:1536 length:1176 start_codon:yes stop_codon:yes gene_type:complete